MNCVPKGAKTNLVNQVSSGSQEEAKSSCNPGKTKLDME